MDLWEAERAIINRWLPSREEPQTQLTQIANTIILGGDIWKVGEKLIIHYLQFIWPYLEILGYRDQSYTEADAPASGVVFFYGCILYISHFSGWGAYIPDMVSYNLLYQLVDHYLDDPKIGSEEREHSMVIIEQILTGVEKNYSLEHPILATVVTVYKEMIDRQPHCRDPMLDLFDAEINSVKIQSNPHLERRAYYNIALNKGAKTMAMLGRMLNVDDIEQNTAEEIGRIMQLLDDCLDVLADRDKSIHTVATYDLAKYGKLDGLWSEIVQRIGRLPNSVNLYKMVYLAFAVYLPFRIPLFSDGVTKVCEPYHWLNFDASASLLSTMERLITELSSGIQSFPGHSAREVENTIAELTNYLKACTTITP